MIKRLTTIIGFVFLLAGNFIAQAQTLSQQAVVPTSTSATISFYLTGAAPGGNILYRISETQAGLAGATITVAGAPSSNATFYGEARTFEVNPLSPNTLYYWDVYFYNSGGSASRLGGSFTTLPANSLPAISGVSANPVNKGFGVNYTAINGNLTTVINYGISETALTSSFIGTSGNGKVKGPNYKDGLLPATKYYYQVVATNANGSVSSAILNTTTLTSNSIEEFNFDNNRQSISGITSFTNGGTFATDRNGNANSAIQLNNSPISTTIQGLPAGKSPKTVSIWVKFIGFGNEYNYIFGSGQRVTSQAYDLFVYKVPNTSTYSIENHGENDNLNIPTTLPAIATTWRHFVTTYDGTDAKVYLDGNLIGTKAVPNWLTSGTEFFLGGYNFTAYGNLGINAVMDDLKIFDKAMSPTEVLNLREFNSPIFTVAPSVTAVVANSISSNSAVIAYKVQYGNITSSVKYGTDANALTSSVIGVSGNDANYAKLDGSIGLPGLLPGTKYYYQVEAINENGTSTSTVGDFTTAASDLVAEFKFDNTRQSVTDAFVFGTGTTTFTTDRFGTPNSAIKVVHSVTGKVAATITGLPSGNAPRTVSTWVKFDSYITSNNGFNAPWGYGNPGDGYGLGIYVDRYNTANHTYMSYSDGSSSVPSSVITNNTPLAWRHMLTTYDGADSKIYLDGVLVHTESHPNWNTQNANNNFVLGGRASNSYGPFDGAVDDLQIYNRALTAQEVNNIYLTNSVTAEVAPILTAIQLSNVSLTAVTVNYKASIGNITSVVKYGTSANSLTNVLNGVAGASSTTTILDGAVELTGLTINTKYYYQVVVTNEFGIKSSEILSFETTPSALLANFTFDQTLTSTNGAYTLSNIGNGAYISSRSGLGNALEMKGSKLSVNIPTLPLGIADRTVSAWFKMDSYAANAYPLVFSYGDAIQYKTFGFYLNNVNRTFQGNGYDYFGTTAAAVANQWYHVVVTLEAGTVKIYFDKTLIITQAVPLLNTTKNVNLDFNIGPFTGGIDDVQIYDRALTLAEVLNLNTYNAIDPKPGVNNIYPSQVLMTTAKINYNVSSPAFTSNVKYGTDANSLSNPITGTASSGFNVAGEANLTGLTANTTYYYQVEVTNANGTTSSAVSSFKTATPNAPNVVAKFDFDNNKISRNGSLTFGAGANTFVDGRDATPNGALLFANNPISVAISTLPIAKTARTVSVWAKITTYVNNYNFVFGYGSTATSSNYGFAVQKDASNNYTFHNYAYGDDVSQAAGTFTNPTDWHHYVTTFDGTSAKIYVDGVLNVTLAKPNWNTTSSNFFLGGNSYGGSNFTGAVDDLVIFDKALTQQEITNLYNTNTLPVTLISYTAKAQNNNAVLNWKTVAEINNSHFVVEKSTDGTNFSQIAVVNAKSTQGADYVYTDNNTTNGTNYYRLTQVDLDGKTTDLGVKAVKFSLENVDVKLYPNPATTVVNLSFEAGIYSKAKLLDMNGKLINTISIAKVQNSISIDLSNVPSGAYLVQLIGTNNKTVKKVIKR